MIVIPDLRSYPVSDIPIPTGPVSAVATLLNSIINEFPTPEQKANAQQAVAQMYLNGQLQAMTTQAGIITAEANSSNKLTSSWRPMLMYIFMAVIANNYIIAPYLQAMFHFGLQLTVPPDMWDLLKLGVGGYVMGRTVEKTASTLTATKTSSGVSVASSVGGAIANVFKGN